MLSVDVERSLGELRIRARFATEPGRITGLFGRSGSGKTSIVNMIAGLLRPDRGRIESDGRTIFDSSAGIDLAPERRRIGYVFQEDRLFPHLSGRRNLLYGRRFVPERERFVTLEQVVDVLGIGHLLDRRPAAMSGGERQRVALGRALMAQPRVMLLDEPLASLDAARKEDVLPFIERLRDEFAIPMVYVSHAMEEIVRLADRVALLSDGAVVATGPTEEVMSRLDLRPLTGRYEAGAVIATRVASHDDAFRLTVLAFAGGELRVPRLDVPVGTSLRVRIRARDVSLALAPPRGISVLNVLPGTVREIGDETESQVDLLIDVGVPLWARITRKSLHDLGIEVGRRVYALIKAAAVDRRSLGRARRDGRFLEARAAAGGPPERRGAGGKFSFD